MKTWKVREDIPKNYLKDLNEPESARRFLFYRGIKTKKEAERFLYPDYERDLADPMKILNMPRAVDRILKAIKDNEKIVIFGDYDADGICGSVIFYDFFQKIGFENFNIYIPDRHHEGYGLTLAVVEKFIKDKTDLIITVDCGITDFDEIKKAKDTGIDVLVIDHHLIPEKPPPAFTILDLHQKEDKYPFKYFSGAGLVFKVIKGLIKKGDFNIAPGWSKWLLDVVALATIADMVPLLGENRVLTHFGITVLQKTRRLGLKHLYKSLKMDISNIAEDDISFLVAPRINIAGRMGHASTGFELLTTNSPNEADWLTAQLEEENNKRKTIVGEILETVAKKFDEVKQLPKVIVVGDEKWPPGVLGLSANRIMDKYLRPVFIWGKGESSHRKGSARSNKGVNLVKLMSLMPANTFLEFGGHAFAAGFTLNEKIEKEDFENNIQKTYEKIVKEKAKPEILMLDGELKLKDANWDLVSLLEKFQPFGMDNPKPVFLFSNIKVSEVKTFGNGGIHLELKFEKTEGKIISAIGFFMENSFEPKIEKGSQINLAASIEKSTFKGYNEIRLRIVDLKVL